MEWKRREFVCKVSRIAYIGPTSILAEFWGEYYAMIDFSQFWDEFPELKRLQEPDVFRQVYVRGYHVRFGPDREVDVDTDFIWYRGIKVKEEINPEGYTWYE